MKDDCWVGLGCNVREGARDNSCARVSFDWGNRLWEVESGTRNRAAESRSRSSGRELASRRAPVGNEPMCSILHSVDSSMRSARVCVTRELFRPDCAHRTDAACTAFALLYVLHFYISF